MSGTKRNLEDISVEIGFGGEINEEVEAEAARRQGLEEMEGALVLYAQHCVGAGRRVGGIGDTPLEPSDDYVVIKGSFDELMTLAKIYDSAKSTFGWRVAGQIREFAYEQDDREPFELAYWKKSIKAWAKIPMGSECFSFDADDLEHIAYDLWEIEPFKKTRFAIVTCGDWSRAEEIEK